MDKKSGVCYLCGQKLDVETDDDHVPPRQFYAKSIRKKYSPNLFTLPVHRACHKPFQKDEDYFVHSLAPLTIEGYPGNELWKDLCVQFERPQGRKIQEMIVKEFDLQIGRLYLPNGKVAKRFNGIRVRRVIWKVTRGLFYKEKNRILPEITPHYIELVSPGEKPPSDFGNVGVTPHRGQYPRVFDYKYLDCDLRGVKDFHFWAMLLWDKLIVIIKFHDPECKCVLCLKEKTKLITY